MTHVIAISLDFRSLNWWLHSNGGATPFKAAILQFQCFCWSLASCTISCWFSLVSLTDYQPTSPCCLKHARPSPFTQWYMTVHLWKHQTYLRTLVRALFIFKIVVLGLGNRFWCVFQNEAEFEVYPTQFTVTKMVSSILKCRTNLLFKISFFFSSFHRLPATASPNFLETPLWQHHVCELVFSKLLNSTHRS